MTNQQLYFAVGVPVLVMVAGFIWTNVSLRAEMVSRFEGLQKQIDQMNMRLLAIETEMRSLRELFGRHDKAIETLERQGR